MLAFPEHYIRLWLDIEPVIRCLLIMFLFWHVFIFWLTYYLLFPFLLSIDQTPNEQVKPTQKWLECHFSYKQVMIRLSITKCMNEWYINIQHKYSVCYQKQEHVSIASGNYFRRLKPVSVIRNSSQYIDSQHAFHDNRLVLPKTQRTQNCEATRVTALHIYSDLVCISHKYVCVSNVSDYCSIWTCVNTFSQISAVSAVCQNSNVPLQCVIIPGDIVEYGLTLNSDRWVVGYGGGICSVHPKCLIVSVNDML